MEQSFANFNDDDDFFQSDKKRRKLREKADAATGIVLYEICKQRRNYSKSKE